MGLVRGRADFKVTSLYLLPLEQNLPKGFHSSAAPLTSQAVTHSCKGSPVAPAVPKPKVEGQTVWATLALPQLLTSLETLINKGRRTVSNNRYTASAHSQQWPYLSFPLVSPSRHLPLSVLELLNHSC